MKSMMNFYQRHLAPRLVNAMCAMAAVTEQRRRIVPDAEGVVVEIGIGSGLNLPYYDPAKVTRVIGIDPGREMASLGRRRFANAPVPVEMIASPAECIPLPDASADTVVMTYCACSIPDVMAAMREMRRVLKPGGRLLFCEHGRSHDCHVARTQDRMNELWRRVACGCNLNRDIASLLDAAGFRIRHLENFYALPAIKPISFHYLGEAVPA